jgi:tyrosyl-tRNA synthetase
MINKELFERGILEIIEEKSFYDKLNSGKKLRIKYGVDPTRPDIHLGHAVSMWKLKQLQDDGHTVIFLIGDYTTKIGDPSGRNTTRPVLTDKEIKENAKTYLDQAGKILDIEKAEVRYNSEWLSGLSFNDIILLAGKFTVAQIIERDDFEKRLKNGTDVSLHELFYPLMQAYDSVVLKADVEFGGSDQKFNMLAGRSLQKKMEQVPQEVVQTKLLVGLDGKVKMSKSADNYISITESAESMFGKIMSIPDEMIIEYFELATVQSNAEIAKYKKSLEEGENPRNLKMALGVEIAKLYHDVAAAEKAQEEFVKVFSNKEMPTEIPEIEIQYGNWEPVILLIATGAMTSNSEARRLVEQGGLKIDNTKITDPKAEISIQKGMIIQAGKKKYFRIK